jgi:hypothetical protein
METTVKQLYVGYQTRSLIEFLLGDGTRPGWLDMQSHSGSFSRMLAGRNQANPA